MDGDVDGEERNALRAILEKEKDCLIIASYGTFSTGVNIINIENTILASPSKGKIRNLQTIGRGLRKGNGKETSDLYDIGDNLRFEGRPNFTLNHFRERIKVYKQEKFDYKIYKIRLE